MKNKFDFIANALTPATRRKIGKAKTDTVQQIIEDHKLEIPSCGPFVASETLRVEDLNSMHERITRLERDMQIQTLETHTLKARVYR